ncbi:MAG TPA: tetratricopeptide repeat protein [Bryobacteraceae bacterium]|nr:tetratricopeptide repeat protein [Bryobacteraceae bacterium]
MLKPLVAAALFCLPALAQSVQDGRYINNSYARVAKHLLAAEQGDPKARFDVALMYEKGEVVSQNHKEALKWLKLAAGDGFAPAQLFLGLMYAAGSGVMQNYPEALKWVHLAADQGDADAQFYLGGVYFVDHIVPHNYVESYKWFVLAASKDTPESAKAREGVRALLSRQELAEARSLIEEWRNRTEKASK